MRSHWLVSTAVAAAMLTPAVALAQTEAPDAASVGLEEIVVTAQRVEENLQRAALAISAVGADQLQRSGVTDVTQLTQLTPSLQVGTMFGPYPALYMRGVGNFSTNSLSDPAIAFSVDGVYFGRQTASGGVFYDLQRVEVLKGPQGTLYGRNATGGAINVLTNKPVMGEYSGAVSAEVGNYDSIKVNGAINIPIGETMAARIAAQSIQHDGYYSDGTGTEDTTSLRAQLAADPTESIHLNFGVDYSKQKGVTGATVVGLNFEDRIGLTDPRAQALYRSAYSPLAGNTLYGLTNDWYSNNEFYGVYMQADIQTPLGTLTVLPAYRRGELDYRNGAASFIVSQTETDEQKSLEVRLASDNDRPVRYLAGLYYFDEDISFLTNYNQGFASFYLDNQPDTTSYAAFGRVTWAVTDRLRLTGGIRYTKDEKSAALDSINALVICPSALVSPPTLCPTAPALPVSLTPPAQYFAPNGSVIPVLPLGGGAIAQISRSTLNPSKDFTKTTWRASAEYDLAPDSLLYASVETGFKAGGFFVSIDNPTYAPETITAYTIGSKNRLFDNRLQLNAELFYWKYKDQQVSHFRLSSANTSEFVTENIGESTFRGVDLDAQFLATENTLITANVQYLDAENNDYTYTNPAAVGPPTVGCPFQLDPVNARYIINCSGQRPVKSPEWTAAFGIQQTIPLSSGAKIILDAHTNYQSESITGQEYLALQQQDSYWLTDLQASFTDADERYEVAAFVNNVTDEAVAGNINLHPRANLFVGALRPPRTYGMRVSAKF
jgi:iron complex outermembrane recepter protein